jgi:phosphatidylglycerol:prolipoprotein diacylglycerol transferase
LVEIGATWLGGLSWVGALAGGLIGLLLAARLFREAPGALADALLPLALVVVTSVWLGCWQSGCVYGPPAESGWWGVPSADESGRLASRLPLQPGAALVTLLLFFVVAWLRPNLKRPGQAAALAFAGLALVMVAVSLLRADPARPVLGWRADGWAAVALALLATAATLLAFKREPLEPSKDPDQDLTATPV